MRSCPYLNLLADDVKVEIMAVRLRRKGYLTSHTHTSSRIQYLTLVVGYDHHDVLAPPTFAGCITIHADRSVDDQDPTFEEVNGSLALARGATYVAFLLSLDSEERQGGIYHIDWWVRAVTERC
jgi:hypothetical protein